MERGSSGKFSALRPGIAGEALESLAYQLKNDEEYKVKLPEYPTSYSEGVSTYGLEVLLRILTPRDVLYLKVWVDTISKYRRVEGRVYYVYVVSRTACHLSSKK